MLSIANVVYCQCCWLLMLSVANVVCCQRNCLVAPDHCSNRLSCWPSSSSAHLVSSFLHSVHRMSLPIVYCICCLATASRSSRACVRVHEFIVAWITSIYIAPKICSSGSTSAPKTKDVFANYFAHLFSFASIVVFHLIFFLSLSYSFRYWLLYASNVLAYLPNIYLKPANLLIFEIA